MLGLNLVLVPLHGRFTTSIEQDKIKQVPLNTMFSVVTCYLDGHCFQNDLLLDPIR